MSTSISGSGSVGGGVGGALSLMGCVRESSPSPPHPQQQQQQRHHYHHHHRQRTMLAELPVQNSLDPLPKETKKRRFHPLRGLRRIFRRKSRGAADSRYASTTGSEEDREQRVSSCSRGSERPNDVTLRCQSERPEEAARSRSASELLTDACDRHSCRPRDDCSDDAFVVLRGVVSKTLSVSHDSVFPGEALPATRPLTSLDSLAASERLQGRSNSREIDSKDYNRQVVQRHRISLRVLEQIKTAIEHRNQVGSSDNSASARTPSERYQQETEKLSSSFDRKSEWSGEETTGKITRSSKDAVQRIGPMPKEELPELQAASLNHTAARHRISIRPKNRRPPRRSTTSQSINSSAGSTSFDDTIPEDNLDSSIEPDTANLGSNGTESRVTVARKPSSRSSRGASDVFDEPDNRSPPSHKQSSCVSLSPDSLDVSGSISSRAGSTEIVEKLSAEPRSIIRKSSNRISKGSDVFEELEAKLPRRRSSSNRMSKSPDSLESPTQSNPACWFSKSSDDFDKLAVYESEDTKPTVRRYLVPSISKSSDSLELGAEALASDDSLERRRGSFEFRNRRASRFASKSTESFETDEVRGVVNLRGRRLSRGASKSSENLERFEDISESRNDEENADESNKYNERRRSSKRVSSESSDNLETDDRLENRRRLARLPRKVPSSGIVDAIAANNNLDEDELRSVPIVKPRMQKSSESSELGSTDTLDSDRRRKSTGSIETLDSLDKDLEQDTKDEEMVDNVVEKREGRDSWSMKHNAGSETDRVPYGEVTEDSQQPIIGTDEKYYWRHSSESKENIDIHQLLALTTIVSRMTENGNDQRASVIYPKKKKSTSSPPTSPVVAKQDDNKIIFDNMLATKNDEDLQNMLNGNISEVSTDTKSFKEKLIMFEKLGK